LAFATATADFLSSIAPPARTRGKDGSIPLIRPRAPIAQPSGIVDFFFKIIPMKDCASITIKID
jgi:hypothetical protein